jgi:hypothetical protein
MCPAAPAACGLRGWLRDRVSILTLGEKISVDGYHGDGREMISDGDGTEKKN